jgi:hypothetical protein
MRLAALIACAWVLGAAAPLQAPSGQQPHDGTGGQQRSQDGQEVPGDDPQEPAVSAVADALQAIARDATPSKEDQAKAAEDRQRDKDQLEADQGAARWAMVAALAALAGLPLSAVGIWLVWGTLRATQAAVGEAGDATDAARKAVEVTEKTAHLQLRPYVYIVDEVAHAYAIHGRPEHRGMAVSDHAPVTFALKNFGQTPAKRVRLRARGFTGEHWTEGGLVDLDAAAITHRADLPPGFDRKVEGYAVNDLKKDFARIRRGAASLFFEGVIEYEDASGNEYVTNFRRACTGDAIHSGVFIITSEGNEAT